MSLYEIGSAENSKAYLGFTYNDVHSSVFHIVRTSDGSRFNESLLPTVQDKAISAPGAPGKILQSSNYDTRVFSVQIAYDSMTEKDMQDMKKWLGDKKIHPLIFDELPYKKWYAKVTGTASMKWIPFNEGETSRTYKGEGTIQFTCYDPFAHCGARWLTEQINSGKFSVDDPEVNEWLESSNLNETIGRNQVRIALEDKENNLQLAQARIYNSGDIETDIKILFRPGAGKILPGGSLSLIVFKDGVQNEIGYLEWANLGVEGEYDEVVINTKMNLIEGYKNGKKTGIIYDEFITAGSYFKIPKGLSTLQATCLYGSEVEIDFDHLYF